MKLVEICLWDHVKKIFIIIPRQHNNKQPFYPF